MEQNEMELEEALAEIDIYEKELYQLQEPIYELGEWMYLAENVAKDLSRFIENMESISSAFKIIENSDKSNYFLIGTLWSGVLGAYEGFVHDFFESLLKKKSISNMQRKMCLACRREIGHTSN
ncbi:hypothetical protein [Plesiomonas shigelloides]